MNTVLNIFNSFVLNLLALMHVKQQITIQNFNFEPTTFDWMEYMKIYCRGARKFILREKTTDAQNKKKAFM